ncbi:MAG TPA: ABC transporter ATP-binding protein, partial [Methanomicrobiales archaeon]|nr:ABC transporter ATP-binding protein [Methanomicrobiales archaeon]
MDAIEADHLSKSFGPVRAVDDVSIRVPAKGIFGFLGPNGAGKTTTIRLLTGILTPDNGSVRIGGVDIHRDPLSAKLKMGVIPENSTVYGDMTAEQNVLWAAKFYGLDRTTREERVREILGRMGLAGREGDMVRTFSKGMRQRVSIACAIVHQPEILVLDEPTVGLDVQSRRLVIDTIRHMNGEGSTIFLTTHYIEEANALCDRVSVINRGRIIATDTPERLRKTFDTARYVEISFDRPVGEDLLDQVAVSRVERHGDKWRLYTDNPDPVVKFLGALAEREHFSILSIATSSPTLEEAFVRLTEGS